ncbi:adenylate/guanylate cyclase domain-containing protein [Variovorax ureilyticus]|uniref:Adenylate/guanylate cyclase domain-containing protein n=1 Tax=Variovorax ureilyticus TaxID=1836198 RepID=A0ABU8VBE9_9BURK
MVASLSAVTRERLRRFMRILRIAAVIGAGVGAIYGGAIAGPGARPLLRSLLISIPIGVIDALLTALWIASIELFLLPRPSMRWLDALPFAAVFLLKTFVYGAIAGVVLTGQPGEHLLGVVTVYNARTGLIAIFLSLVPVAVIVMMFQAAGLVGYRTFTALLLGKYRRPNVERRFFLFADVVGSTAIAERLGPLEAHRFLAAVFSAVAEPIELYRGEIYQYVGDEIVITWVEADGVADARALRCFFAMRAALAADANRFAQRFGASPKLRAALHLGEVIAGEVGQVRRAIVFHGDVMNTTGRLEQATREVGCFFITSAQALASLGPPPPDIRVHDLGALPVRGRLEPIHAFCVEQDERDRPSSNSGA